MQMLSRKTGSDKWEYGGQSTMKTETKTQKAQGAEERSLNQIQVESPLSGGTTFRSVSKKGIARKD